MMIEWDIRGMHTDIDRCIISDIHTEIKVCIYIYMHNYMCAHYVKGKL